MLYPAPPCCSPQVTRALDLLTKQAPALLEAALLHARALYLNGVLDAALRKAGDILRMNPEESSAHLLICSVYVAQVGRRGSRRHNDWQLLQQPCWQVLQACRTRSCDWEGVARRLALRPHPPVRGACGHVPRALEVLAPHVPCPVRLATAPCPHRTRRTLL